MITNFRRHCSIASLLLIAGTILIVTEGPMMHSRAGIPFVPVISGAVPAKGPGATASASVSIIYGIDASGKVEIVKKTSTLTPLQSVSHANGSVTTTDKLGHS